MNDCNFTPYAFPTLYKKSGDKGAIQQWDIKVSYEADPSAATIPGVGTPSHPAITTTFGIIGGKIQTSSPELIREGKNLGKKNETTAWSQALLDAKSKWELQKKKKGYVETVEAAKAGEVDDLVQGGIFPMLAQKFEKRSDKIEYPAYVQPKMDGHRCIAIVKDGKCTLWSRTRKPINSLPHIVAAIEKFTGGADAILDGELYNHEYHANFEQITKLIRPAQPVEGHEKVQYWIYDMPSAEFQYADRWRMINQLFARNPQEYLVNVETIEVANEEEVVAGMATHLSRGFEGAMLRTSDGPYLSHSTRRSADLLKIKTFQDAEFLVVDVVQGTGKMEGKAIFVCKAGNGETFDAVMNCSLEQLKDYYDNRQAYIGLLLTVKFFGFTKAKNVPRFPRALRFREDL